MFFRFAAALILVVAVSMTQVGLEKQSLKLRRAVSRQYYQMDELLELHAQLRLDIQQLSAPSRFLTDSTPQASPAAPHSGSAIIPPTDARPATPKRLPVVRWARPVRPDGVTSK